MKIRESNSTNDGRVIKIIQYENIIEKLKHGSEFAIQTIDKNKTSEVGYNYYGQAKKDYDYEIYRDLIKNTCKNLSLAKEFDKFKADKTFKDIVIFLQHYCMFEYVFIEPTGINTIMCINFKKKSKDSSTSIQNNEIGKFNEYILIPQELVVNLIIEFGAFGGVSFVGVDIDKKRILKLDDSDSNYQNDFFFCYAANNNYGFI